MADCYYHGYSGSPGPCSQCEAENRRNLDKGTLGSTLDSDEVVDLANQNSIGKKAAGKERAKKNKK
jgi:hypothetical protein